MRARYRALFDSVAPLYDQAGVPYFGPIAAGLLQQLDVRPGARVADVGSGRGALTLPLAEAVGPEGHVDAVDQSGEMVRLLTETVADLPQVRVVQADATELPQPPYDVVAASLVLFFLPDPVAVLRAWREALRPRGRVGITTFAPWTDRWQALAAVARRYASHPEDSRRIFVAEPPWDTDEAVERLFTDAGLREVETVRHTITVALPDAATFERWAFGSAARVLWLDVPEERRGDFDADLARTFESWRDEDGMTRLDVAVRYTLGRR
jgi:ubiquinone/menaquinone biosynthesis C-methylase UbiE